MKPKYEHRFVVVGSDAVRDYAVELLNWLDEGFEIVNSLAVSGIDTDRRTVLPSTRYVLRRER